MSRGLHASTRIPNAVADPRDVLADAAEPDEPERLAVQDRRERRRPLAAAQRRVARRNLAHHGLRETDRELRGADRVAARGLRDHDARVRRGLEVDVRGVVAGLRDHLHVGQLREQLARELRALAVRDQHSNPRSASGSPNGFVKIVTSARSRSRRTPAVRPQAS